MTRLGIRVTDFVRANPGLTLEEISRGVRARTAAVRDVLVGEGFSASLRMSYPSDRAQVYRVAVAAADGPGMVARPSQASRVAQLLGDGRWHTASEIHRRCGTMRLNSRIAELRKTRGWEIVCEFIKGETRGPDAYRYRLVGTSERDEASQAVVARPAAVDGGCAPSASSRSDASAIDGASGSDVQLGLEAA